MRETDKYQVGKGKPPLNRRFGQPEGNPNGKTSEQKRLELANAEAAMRIRAAALAAIEEKLVDVTAQETIEMLVDQAMLKLLKDSEDRGLGAPVQAVDHTTNGKDMAVTAFVIEGVAPDDAAKD